MRWVAVAICLVVSASAWAQQPDWGVTRDPFDPGTIARYKSLLARDPYDDGALRQLSTLYKRHRSIAKLEAEYREKIASGDDWASLVVLARLPAADAVALWKRAVAIKPDDARAWIAIGDAAKSDAVAARDAYTKAAKAATTPKLKRAALVKVVSAARDHATIDGAYAELIAMSPKDGVLWLDRGNAQLLAKQYGAAKDSYTQAEQLLATDPERRLAAMTSQGIVLDAMGRPDEALAQYERTLDKVPRGYFLGQEIVLRIVETERKRGRLGDVISRFEKRWPENKRGHFEWALFGDLFLEQGREGSALEAYRRAVKKAPEEVATQRKLIALLDKSSSSEALVQHEAAAKVAPGDAPLLIELAKRYHADQPGKAIVTLETLAKRMASNVSVRSQIADLYDEWNEPARAIVHVEAITKLEPKEPDHALRLGDMYWRANQREKAFAAWKQLDTIGTKDSLFRYGETLAMHDAWEEAAEAYTKTLGFDAAYADALYGRARAYESLTRYPESVADARRAVALTALATQENGLRNRNLLVRVLGKSYERGDHGALGNAVARWRFAFDHGDLGAGYLLAAHHGRIRSHQHHDVIVELYRAAPNDDSLGMTVARSYLYRREFAKARVELEKIGQRSQALQKEVASLIEQVDEERERAEREIRWEEQGRSHSTKTARSPDIVGEKRRLGLRLELGTDVRKASGALMGIGLYRTHRVAKGTAWTWRFDWMKRDDDMLEHQHVGFGAGITTRLLDARRFEVAAGGGASFELRYGNGIPNPNFDRAALGGDITVEVFPRALPAVLGLHFHHSLTDAARSSTLLVELGFEVR